MTRRSVRRKISGGHTGPPLQRSLRGILAIATLSVVFSVESAHAKGGSDISVTTTATISGTVVRGTITITNTTSKTANVTAVTSALEVRYATGSCVSLPPGTVSGY